MNYTDLMDARDVLEVARYKCYLEYGHDSRAWRKLAHAVSHVQREADKALGFLVKA